MGRLELSTGVISFRAPESCFFNEHFFPPHITPTLRLCFNFIEHLQHLTVIISVLANWNIKTAKKTGTINRTLTATLLAAVMHLTGALGMLFWRRDWFLMLTPFNLLVMFFLLIWTLPEKDGKLYSLMISAFVIGTATEMIGVKTGFLFGHYEYGNVLGLKINGVPLLIGINWFIIVYASGMLAQKLRLLFNPPCGTTGQHAFSKWLGTSIIIDGAVIATMFDILMEPAAVRLGFWSWQNDTIPLMNYLSWFMVSVVILFLMQKTPFKIHQFAINLLIIEAIFFLAIH
jgi:bisanhydrobacterioruberin hydratase